MKRTFVEGPMGRTPDNTVCSRGYRRKDSHGVKDMERVNKLQKNCKDTKISGTKILVRIDDLGCCFIQEEMLMYK